MIAFPRLLAIDDEAGMLTVLRAAGESAGYEVFATSDPQAFLRYALEWSPTLVLIDLQMPESDGVEILRRLASHDFCGAITIMSGVDDKLLRSVRDLARDLGLNIRGTLSKPIRIDVLRRVLAEHAGQSSSNDIEDLRQAIAREELVLYYQPIVHLPTRELVAVEALIRWRHPLEGLLPPDRFIPLAEANALIDDITWYVFRRAVAQLRCWSEEGLNTSVSINISAANLSDPRFPEMAATLCQENNVATERICLELTETATIADAIGMKAVLSRIRLKNFRVALDDFGMGYSSMKQLRLLPFSELKIDKSFVEDMLNSEDASIIVNASLALGGAFRVGVVAEGIETESQLAALVERGCTVGQGFLFSRAVPPQEIAQRCASGNVVAKDESVFSYRL